MTTAKHLLYSPNYVSYYFSMISSNIPLGLPSIFSRIDIDQTSQTFAANFGIAHQNTTLSKAYIQNLMSKKKLFRCIPITHIIMVRRETFSKLS